MMDSILKAFKRPQVWGFFVSVAAMAIISLAFFYPDNFEGNQLMQSDMQQGMANNQESVEFNQATGEKALWTNALFSGMPTFQIAPVYQSNSLFNWINVVYGLWLPGPSNLLFMMMFGFLIFLYCMRARWPYALIGAIAWGFSSYFIIIIGAGHIWKFLALTYIPPTIGGLVLCYRGRYMLGGGLTALFAMMQLNANHPQMSYYFGFVMAGFVIAYLISALRKKQVKRWGIATGVIVGAGLLALGANLPSLYNTYEYQKETKRSQSELTLAPPAGADTATERPTGGMPKSDIINWSYGKSEMFSLLVPNIKGGASAKPEQGKMVAMSLDGLDKAKDAPYDVKPLLPYFSQYFNDSEGTNGPVYVGAIICALFLLGCIIVRGPLKWVLIGLTLLSILLSLGRNFMSLTDFMIYNFPLYNKFRAVESILVIAEFTIPVLAIMALVKFMKQARDGKCSYPALYISFGICGLICLCGMFIPQIFGSTITTQDMELMRQIQEYNPNAGIDSQRVFEYVNEMRLGMVSSDSWRSLLFLAGAFAILAMVGAQKMNQNWALAVIGALVLSDMYGVDKRYLSHDSFVRLNTITAAQYDPFAPDAIDQAILADKGLSYRVMDIPGFWSPNRSYRHKMIGGYHAAKLNRYEDLIQNRMKHVMGIGYIPELREDSIVAMYSPEEQETIRELVADYRVLDMLNARYIITGDKNALVVINPDALGNAWLITGIKYVDNANQEMDALATLDPAKEAVADKKFEQILGRVEVAPAGDDAIQLTSYTPNELKYAVNTRSGGIAVFSEVYFPWGWNAKIEGSEAELGRVNYVLRALRVPAGRHEITMTFDPKSLHATSGIAYACVTFIYLWVMGGIFTAIVRKEEEEENA